MDLPSKADIMTEIEGRRNWNRWGGDDQLGTMNMLTEQKVLEAARSATIGRRVSLSRPIPVTPAPNNLRPAHHFMERRPRASYEGAGVAADFLFTTIHGASMTHIDALCHIWDHNGMWNGRNPDEEVTIGGTRWGGIEQWQSGFITRGVLLDVPAYRGTEYVDYERPVTGTELVEVAKAQGVEVRPGDAVAVYAGREKWEAGHTPWGAKTMETMSALPTGLEERPGLHASCLTPLRDWDVAMLLWDMLDYGPNGYDIPWSVHAAIHSYGLALVDNALLEPLSDACRDAGKYDFMLSVAPLVVIGGTGSPVNPIAVL